MLHSVLQSEAARNAFAKQVARPSERVSNDRFLGDLNLKTDIFNVHALLFSSIHVINVTDLL